MDKEIKVSRDGRTVTIRLPNKRSPLLGEHLLNQRRKQGALDYASSFFADNSAFLLDNFGQHDEDGMDLTDLPTYKRMVDRLRYARVSEMALRHHFSQLVENSPHSPTLEVGRAIADKFVDTVMTDAERFKAESGARKSATLSRKK